MSEGIKSKKRPRCYNCAHAGQPFKIFGNTHHHCTHPSRIEGIREDELSAWDTLVEWWHTCDNWEPKKKKTDEQDNDR